MATQLSVEAVDAAYDLRRREFRTIVPLTLLAAVGFGYWRGVTPALVWAAAVICMCYVDLAVYRHLSRRRGIARHTETLMCVMSFSIASVYAILPASLLMSNDVTAMIAAIAVISTAAQRNMNDIALSARVCGAALTPYFVLVLLIPFMPAGDASAAGRGLAMVALVAMFGYVAKGWIQREMLDGARRRAMAESLEQTRARVEAEDANSAKSRFLANMSHELRTPLNAIIGYGELMREGALEQRRTGDVEDHDRVLGAARQLLRLIGDILDFSKIEAGRMEVESIDFDPAALARDAVEVVRPAAAANGDALLLDVAPDLGGARTDAFKLNQCLLNLLANAVKFTKDGTITLRGRREDIAGQSWLVFSVSDTGSGVSPSQLARLFQPFVQADASNTRVYGGTGLGLSITRRLAQLLGGDITADSVEGHGSTFVLRAPAIFAAPSAQDQHGAPDRPASMTPAALASAA